MSSSVVIRVRAEGQEDSVAAETLRRGIEAIRAELGVAPEFPPEVERAAAAAAAAPRLPELDRTDLDLVTIDPAGSMDLDQALHLERAGDGYVVHYAIADLAAFITPGDPIDLEAHRRGETLYGADSKIPLHPKVISEDAGSLLPDQVRPALLWSITIDGRGERTDVHLERALVRSRARLDYDAVQRQIDGGSASPSLQLLQDVGRLRIAREAARGGVSLPLPEQGVEITGDTWHLEYRKLLPVEEWNAQISLLTGFAAASLMVYARVGLLRTLPPPDPRDVQRLHRTARALGIAWPAEMLYPDFVRTLDPEDPRHAAMVVACTRLLRGSGYAAFDGELPAISTHAALASEYAHVTAPLRRLGDRYALEVCVALCAGTDVPAWVHDALPGLPATLQESARRAHQYERAVIDLVEAGVLAPRVGEEFPAVVVDVSGKDALRGTVTIEDPAVEAPATSTSPLPLGADVRVRLASADVVTRKVAFELVGGVTGLETQRQSVPRSDDGELDTTMAFLRFVRGCVVKKLDGLDEELVRRPVVASGTSLLGLVWHLAVAERYWVGWTFAGLLDDSHDWDFGMDVPDGSTVADVLEEYDAAARDTDAIVAAAAGPEARVARAVDGRHLSLRWVLAHLTGETTRHAGHADILRELIDGTTGR